MLPDKIFQLNKGVLAEIKKAVDEGNSPAVFYAAEQNRYHITSQLDRPFIYVAGDTVSARKAYESLTEYAAGPVALIPDREDFLIPRKTAFTPTLFERIKGLVGLAKGDYVGAVVTAEGYAQFFPDPKVFLDHTVTIKKGEVFDPEKLASVLAETGYKRVTLCESSAEFSVRGDVTDVFPVGEVSPVRITFFGDEIESIKFYDPASMQYKGETDEITVMPATDILIPQNEVNGILNNLKKNIKNLSSEAMTRIGDETERFIANPSSPLNGLFIPYSATMSFTLSDYLPENGVIVYDEIKQVEDKIRLIRNRLIARVNELKGSGFCFDAHKNGIADFEKLSSDAHVKLGFGRMTSTVTLFEVKSLFNVRANALPAYYNDMESFFAEIKTLVYCNASICVVCKDKPSLDEMAKNFADRDISCYEGENRGGLSLTVGSISKGFIYPAERLMLVGINDYSRKSPLSRSAKAKRAVFEIPEKGDYVVHEKHGIGISEGIKKVKTLSGEKDYYVVLYKDGDRLYLPCDQLDTLEKYNGGDCPSLHKLGGAEFERVKKKVRESIRKMAVDLLSLYRARYDKKGYKYQPDTVWQKEMEEDFPYVETDDQLAAIAEIKKDMERGKIMDRLLCGDVGYGKTEVAARAIFKTVVEGKQAAVLSPTTILCQQHYRLLKDRFAKFGIKVDLLSRFVSASEIKKVLERTAKGENSVIVATHRLLSKDVKFHDLGLLVLDEEQRFGVEHKELIKSCNENVNILSLSATPIPRTLHMALSGIRDISTLEMPPRNRLPVETYVTEYSDNLLKDAANKELSRGGQVFILYNKVRTIENFYKHVKELLPPEVNIIYAHGQMEENVLEDRIRDFYENKAQVLISTTIIENGIDLPNANTLFVIDSDALGLSQAYQLRGRVGRSDVQSYAYFTVQEGKVLTKNAMDRLNALMDNTDLGSGFRIAMRDLEIRGAGNILGREQHGQMEKVGYEMYLKLIKEGVDEARGINPEEVREVDIKVEGDYALDDSYIPDERARVTFYKKVSVLASRREGQDYYDYLKKNYGPPPKAVRTVIRVAVIKNLALRTGINRVVIGEKGTGLYFSDNRCLTDEKMSVAMEKYSRYAVLSPTNTPVVVFDASHLDGDNRIRAVLGFLSVLAGEE